MSGFKVGDYVHAVDENYDAPYDDCYGTITEAGTSGTWYWVQVDGAGVKDYYVHELTPVVGAKIGDARADFENDRQRLLQTAEQLVCGDRNKSYGAPTEDFTRTAALWSAWKGVHFDPWEVAVFMVLLKQSRLRASPEKDDSWIDTAGYAACGLEVATETLA